MKKIGLYGGTFNPIHIGHMEAAKFAKAFLGLDEIYLIPNGVPPHKQISLNTPNSEDRLSMVKLAANSIGAKVDDTELRRKGKSYTIDTIMQYRERYNTGDEFYLMMGTDMFLSFHKWKDPGKISKYCKICTFSRSSQDNAKWIQKQKEYLSVAYETSAMIIPLDSIIDISSSQIREYLKENNPESKNYLDKSVYEYIKMHSLYGVHNQR